MAGSDENGGSGKSGGKTSENAGFDKKTGTKEQTNLKKIWIPSIAGIFVVVLALCLIFGVKNLVNNTELGGGDSDASCVLVDLSNAFSKTIKSGNFHLFKESSNNSYIYRYDLDIEIDQKTGELFALGTQKQPGMREDSLFGIYKGQKIYLDDEGDLYYTGNYDLFFFTILFANEHGSLYNVDIEEFLTTMGNDPPDEVLDDYFNADVNVSSCQKSLENFLEKLNSESWLKENANFKVETRKGGTSYYISIDAYTLNILFLECIEPAFENKDELNDIKDDIEDNKKNLRRIVK